ncbi:MAG: histidine--tRNA ligase [Bacteroidetes bacterium]|nr:MAG: histidine--tRNA ligase [Bacteroidota bacterium]TAG88164.1 MAG: histidine--tRNA ligase [Bacteroidota bacterium]
MDITQPSLVRGTRDFSPEIMVKRNYILQTIRKVFEKFGFLPLETPSIEKLEVLTGKYGEEGDQLIFKILNSGDYLKDISTKDLEQGSKKLTPKISEKALRYDLTVPFARFVAMNRGTLSFPFKRYQIQPVWRGDNPQKGRYREFYQCDADVVGTKSLLCEVDIILMINEVLNNLGVKDFTIKINHREILTGLAEVAGAGNQVADLCVAIDKIDKIGIEKVELELKEKGFNENSLAKIQPLLALKGNWEDKKEILQTQFVSSEAGKKGIEDLSKIFELLSISQPNVDLEKDLNVAFDLTLARGLSYYTGAIFEVKINQVTIGSVSGGGRYDNLTASFGVPNLAGVGFSFGIDRLFDVLEELKLFPENTQTSTQVMFTNFDEIAEKYALPLVKRLRDDNIKTEIYPESAKLKKQFGYADAKKIPYVIVIGSDEMQNNLLTFRNMQSGEQQKLSIENIIEFLKK